MKGFSKYSPLFIGCFAALISFTSCDSTPDGVMSKRKFTDFLVDFHKGEALTEIDYSAYRQDSDRMSVRQAVFDRHGINKQIFDSTLMWYAHHPDKYNEVYDNVIERLEDDIEKAGSVAVVSGSIMGDSVNAWQGSSYYVINRRSPSDFLQFRFDSDETWEKGDTYVWQFKTGNRQSPVEAGMYIEYADSTIDYTRTDVEDDGWTRLTVVMDTTKTPLSVIGFINVDPAIDEEMYIDSLSLVRKRFDPVLYRKRYSMKKFRNGN